MTTAIAYIDAQPGFPPPNGPTCTFMDFGQGVSTQRSQTSYDTEAGARVHFNSGGVTLSPAAFLGYQRIDQVDAMSSTVTVPTDVAVMSSFGPRAAGGCRFLNGLLSVRKTPEAYPLALRSARYAAMAKASS